MRTISFKPHGTNNILYDFIADDEKIKLVSKDIVNVTRLTYKDSGQYITGVDVKRGRIISGVVERYEVIVLQKGKICI